MSSKKSPSPSTVMKWNREVLNETASQKTKEKLADYVADLVCTTGLWPSSLKSAYLKVIAERDDALNAEVEAAEKKAGWNPNP